MFIELRQNESNVNELKPNKLFIIRKNKDYQEVKEMSNASDSHLAMFINSKFMYIVSVIHCVHLKFNLLFYYFRKRLCLL